MTNNIRLMGLFKLVAGSLVFVIVATYFMSHGLTASNPVKIIGFAAPGAFALVGLVEVTTGMPLTQVSSAWDALAGWQRGVLGILIVALAFVLMMAGIALFA
jgi:hypothetical protein